MSVTDERTDGRTDGRTDARTNVTNGRTSDFWTLYTKALRAIIIVISDRRSWKAAGLDAPIVEGALAQVVPTTEGRS